MNRLKAISGNLRYNRVIGTGGIGTGIFFQLAGNDTLGREESRMASLLPYRDYCKLHIMMHYISTLLGEDCRCTPIGSVGNDEAGRKLTEEMQSAGIDTGSVQISSTQPTLFSVCYQYPNLEGGNITTAESASSGVSANDIDKFFQDRNDKDNEIVLAVPEVPVATRIRLLEHGRERKSLNVSAVSSSEIEEFDALNGFALSDYLFINSDEAQKIARTEKDVVQAAIAIIIKKNPAIALFVTAGSKGVYCYSHGTTEFVPALNVDVKSTAGAGDAFLAGTLCGICCGLNDLAAAEFGVVVAAASVTSPDTINHSINADYLYNFIKEKITGTSPDFMKIFNRN